MNKTLLLQVHWHVLIAASACFAAFAFLIGRAGLKWPLAPALFCVIQGILSLPLLYWGLREVEWSKTDPKWILIAAAIGLTGFLCFTHELGRINSLKIADLIRGTSIASMISIEVTFVMLFHFWDVRRTTEKISLVNIGGMLLIVLGILCVFKRNASQKQSVPSPQVIAFEMVGK